MFPTVKVATIILHEGKVLVGKDTTGKWRVPGGPVNEFETVQAASERTFKETTGVTVKPEHILFVTEVISAPFSHDVVIYAYGQYAEGEPADTAHFTEVQFVDVRELHNLQQDMSDETIDAFYKFSLILRQQAGRQVAQG